MKKWKSLQCHGDWIGNTVNGFMISFRGFFCDGYGIFIVKIVEQKSLKIKEWWFSGN